MNTKEKNKINKDINFIDNNIIDKDINENKKVTGITYDANYELVINSFEKINQKAGEKIKKNEKET